MATRRASARCSARSSGSTPIPAGAPAPLPPVAPGDTRAPRLRARVPRRQRVLKLRGAIAYAGCNERCTVAAAAVLRIGKRRLKMRGVRRVAQASQRAGARA